MCKVSDIQGLCTAETAGGQIKDHKACGGPNHCITNLYAGGGTYKDAVPHKRQRTGYRHGD